MAKSTIQPVPKSLIHPVRTYIRNTFVAGMFIAMPLGITVAILVWVWGQLVGPLRVVFGFTDQPGSPWAGIETMYEGSRWGELIPPLMGLAILLVAVFLLGVLVRSIVGRFFLGIFESLVARVPIVGVLYTSIKQLGEAFLDDKGTSKFKSAVLVQWPLKGCWVIGFVTGEAEGPIGRAMEETVLQGESEGQGKLHLLTVFVPTTPLPTQGFTLVIPRRETRPLDVSVEDALKLVISGGIIGSPEEKAKPVQHPAPAKVQSQTS